MTAWRNQIVQLQSGQRGPLGWLADELNDADPVAHDLLANGFAQWAAAISRGLRAMQDHGELRVEADPDRLALGTLAALQGGLLLSRTLQSPDPLAAGLDRAVECIPCCAPAAA